MLSLSCSISHFLNCLLSSCPTPSCTVPDQIHKKRSRNKSKKTNSKQSPLAPTDSVEWANLTPKTLWLQIKNEAKSYFDWNLPVDNIDAFVEMIKLTKLNLLRSFCQKTGVQIMLREYQFENKTVQTFSEDDIVNMYPIVKHINPRQVLNLFLVYFLSYPKFYVIYKLYSGQLTHTTSTQQDSPRSNRDT